MADSDTSNDDKQLIELKLVSLLHTIALREYYVYDKKPSIKSNFSGCLPNPEKNEFVLKSFIIYAIKNHKQSLVDNTDSSILSVFKQAISDVIKSKESYALAVCENLFRCFVYFILHSEWYWTNVIRRSVKRTKTFSSKFN
jgi:hypothetical protein